MTRINRNASEEEVANVERAIDESLESLSLPAGEYFEALWHFLTVSEDIPRWVILRGSETVTEYGECAELLRLSSLVDDNKYALRYLFEIIKQRLSKARRLSRRVCSGETSYTTAAHSLLLAHDYRTAVGLFSFYHSGDGTCTIDETGEDLRFTFPNHSMEYVALGYSVVTEETGSNMLAMLFEWLKDQHAAPAVARQIGNSVAKIGLDRLVYEFDGTAAKTLARVVPSPESWNLVPSGWTFPWGNRTEVMALWNSLLVRCAYHVVAINFGADQLQIVGGGLDDLCLRIKRGELVQQVRHMCQAPLNRIVRFVNGLTYGQETRTPDPALQPLIPCGGEELLLPCLHILSARGSRNLLSLHARIDEKSFNAQSSLFEQAMVGDIAAMAAGKFSLVRTQFNFRSTGEIDLVIVDDTSATILIGELRWMIPPGDVRETVNRIKVCGEKVLQVGRKTRGVADNVATFLRLLGWKGSITPMAWEIFGFVVTENFVFRSANMDIPMVPLAVLRLGLEAGLDAKRLYSWLRSESWLPKKGQHFEIAEEKMRFGRFSITQDSVSNPRPFKYMREFLPGTLKDFIGL